MGRVARDSTRRSVPAEGWPAAGRSWVGAGRRPLRGACPDTGRCCPTLGGLTTLFADLASVLHRIGA